MGVIADDASPLTGWSKWTESAIILTTCLSSIVVANLRQPITTAVPIAIILGQPLWLYRLYKHDWKLDFSLFLIIGFWINGATDFKLLSDLLQGWSVEDRTIELQIFAILILLAMFAGAIVYRGEESNDQDDGALSSTTGSISLPLLLPGLALPLVSRLWLNELKQPGPILKWSVPTSLLETRLIEVQVFATLVLLAVMAGVIVLRGDDTEAIVAETWSLKDFLLPPLLIPGRTAHTRFFPEKHSFNYSYLSVGIPVGWKGRAGSALSADVDSLPSKLRRRGWFNINAADYLYRGGPEVSLKDRLGTYLRGEGVSDGEWSFAYLVTQPRFLGYSFNPVSFWYIYTSEKRLKWMILEVNNTFDERRIYLLKATDTVAQQPPLSYGDSTDEDKDATPSAAVKFTNSWKKDFHVSPFNSRKGTYALTAVDPFLNVDAPDKKLIDNVIVLKSSKDHPKLVARLFSEGSARDPFSISDLELVTFLARWFWVGFMTFPRILREAWKLHFKRGLHVWFRPEILSSSIGRKHSQTELLLERFFRQYLTHLIRHCAAPLTLHYVPPNSMNTTLTLSSPAAVPFDPTAAPRTITLAVLTPAFYSRLPHYSHTAEALDREGLCADDKNRTLAIDGAAGLRLLLLGGRSGGSTASGASSHGDGAGRSWSWSWSWRWRLLYALRGPPPGVACPSPVAAAVAEGPSGVKVTDIRTFPPSDLDRFVCAECAADDVAGYVGLVTKTFLANRFAGGFEGVLSVFDFVLRAGLAVLGMVVARGMAKESGATTGFEAMDVARMVAVNGIHLWSLAKG